MQELITFRVSNKEEGKAGRGAARGEIVIPQVSKKRARAESDGMGWISIRLGRRRRFILFLTRHWAGQPLPAQQSPTSSCRAKDFSIYYNRDDMTRRILLAHKFIPDDLDCKGGTDGRRG